MMEQNPVFKLTKTMKATNIQPIEKPENNFAFTGIPITSNKAISIQKQQKTKDMKAILLQGTGQIITTTSGTPQIVRNIASNFATTNNRHKTKWHFVSLVLLLLLIQGVAWGQTVNLYLQNTVTQSGTGTFIKDLALTQGSSGTVISQGTTSGTFAEMLAFTRDINNLTAPISGNSFPVSVNVNAVSSANLLARFRLQRVNSSGVVQASSTSYSSTFNTNGTKSATFSFASVQTWASGDRIRLSIEVELTSGSTARTITVNTGNANSYVQYSTPTLTASTLTAFGPQCINNTFGPNSFTITGTNLTSANVTVGALAGFTYSTTSGGTYSSSLTLTQSGGSYSQQIFVKFSPTAEQSYNGNIPVGGGGANSINVAASGSGVNTAPTVTASAATGISVTSATLPGTITVTGCTAISFYGIEYSTVNNFSNGTGTPVQGSNLTAGAFSVTLSGLTQSTTYYYHTFAINDGGTSYSAQRSFTTLSPTISTGTINNSPFCVTASAGSAVSVPFTSVGTFTGNTYTAELSSSTGSFTTPTPIGTLASDLNAGTIDATIPQSTATGTGYRIRVISSNPSVIGTDNGTNLTINLPAISIGPNGIQNINAGVNGTQLTVTESPAANIRVWATTTTSGLNYIPTGSTGPTFTPNFATQGTYYVVCISTFDCTTVTSNEVQVNVSATIATGLIFGSPFCSTASGGSAVSVPFTSVGTFIGNTYTAQLSSATGSFTTPTTIGTLTSDANTGTINATIPPNTATGTLYRIRVISSNPAVTGAINGSN